MLSWNGEWHMNECKASGAGSRAVHDKDKDMNKGVTFPLCLSNTAHQLLWNYRKPVQLVAHVGHVPSLYS